MKKLLLLLIITSISLSAQSGKAFEINKKLGKGVNIIGYDPIWKNFGHFNQTCGYYIFFPIFAL
jgi:hypothetical protein